MSFNYSMDAYVKRLYGEAAQRRSGRPEEGTEAWREALLGGLRQALGRLPVEDAASPLEPVLLETKDYGDFVMERIAYSTMPSVTVPVLVLKPKDGEGPWPAVIACHGHGNGQLDAVGMDPEEALLDQPGIHNRFAVELVKRGLLVVIPEIMGFGLRRMTEEMRKKPHLSSCATLSSHLLMQGSTLAGIRIYEARRAIDYLQSRKDVESGRVGIIGFSGGGLVAAYTAALDDRISAAVLTGWTNTFEGSILSVTHCIDNYLPGILNEAEQQELVGLIAPRPLFVEAGEGDRLFPVEHVRKAAAYLEGVYERMGAGGQFGLDVFPGGHEISGRISFDWLAERLFR
ncbi:dienelactone hydrolase family protein [Paenibacillus sp. CC-CFT747]|nr:dienelactone hydrolase family protein [Paenibacillus sp. CC-CFT747]